MNYQEKVHNLIILDESGSMNSIKKQIISGFNELVQTVKGIAKEYPEQEHLITFISFNGLKITTHLDAKSTRALKEINGRAYKPNASTPLYDAMGFAINKLRANEKAEKKTNTLVTILTDGVENASKEYDNSAIKALVEEMEEKNWTFTYIGADHNVEAVAMSLSIKNSMTFGKNEAGLKQMFETEKVSRMRYSKRISQKKSTKSNYYSEED